MTLAEVEIPEVVTPDKVFGAVVEFADRRKVVSRRKRYRMRRWKLRREDNDLERLASEDGRKVFDSLFPAAAELVDRLTNGDRFAVSERSAPHIDTNLSAYRRLQRELGYLCEATSTIGEGEAEDVRRRVKSLVAIILTAAVSSMGLGPILSLVAPLVVRALAAWITRLLWERLYRDDVLRTCEQLAMYGRAA